LKHVSLGAQSLQAGLDNVSTLLFLSPLPPDPTAPARGGVPVLFPQFADQGPLPKHGFARNLPWDLEHDASANDDHTVVYELDIHPHTHPKWSHRAHLRLTTVVSTHAARWVLEVTNMGETPFEWTGGLHPYWYTPDLLLASLRGFHGATVKNRYQPAVQSQAEPALRWNGQVFECLYDTSSPVELDTGMHRLQLSMTGFDQWMVWNPGMDGARLMGDLPDDDWRRFVCVEPVVVSRPVALNPGETFIGSLSVENLASL
jgi:glucose-6-phosphate 1-epimerase